MYCLDTDNECCKMNYKDYIKEVQDFPVEGVNFKDISPLLGNRKVFNKALDDMFCLVEDVPDYWVGIDARGFIFGSSPPNSPASILFRSAACCASTPGNSPLSSKNNLPAIVLSSYAL